MPDIADVAWSEHDERNSEAVPNGWPTGAFPAYTDQVGQMMMGATKRFWNKINPVYQTTGTGDNYVVQTEIGIDQINLYEILCIRIDRSNTTTTPTLQFGTTNARTIVKAGPSGYVPLAAGDMFAGNSHTFWYNGAFYILVDPALIVGTTVQPYSPNLTSWAAITRATGFDTWVASPTSANLAALVGDETGTGALVFATSPTLVTPALGTPVSGVMTNVTGLPVATGISGLGTGVATFLATPSSANLAAAVTDETGTGSLVFGTAPTVTLPNATGLPLTTGVTGILPIANGGWNAADAASGRLNFTLPVYVTSIAALQALDTTKDAVAVLDLGGRSGIFLWTAGNFSTQIAADTLNGIYVKANAIASTAGAWVRVFAGPYRLEWFGGAADGTTNNVSPFNVAVAVMGAGGGAIELGAGTYLFTGAVNSISVPLTLRGQGAPQTILSINFATADFITVTAGICNIFDLKITSSVTRTAGYFIKVDTIRANIHHCYFENPYKAIGLTKNCTLSKISFCEIRNITPTATAFGSGGIDVGDTATSPDPDSCTISFVNIGNDTSNHHYAGIHVLSATALTIVGCNILQGNFSVLVDVATGCGVLNLKIDSSYLDSSTTGALYMTAAGTGNIARVMGTGSWFSTANQGDGVTLAAIGTGTSQGVSLVNCEASVNSGSGVKVNDAKWKYISVIGCRVAQNTIAGVSLVANAGDVNIQDSSIGSVDGMTGNGTGISLAAGTGTRIEIQNNKLIGNTTAISNGATGTNRIEANEGYNSTPVGASITVGASPYTYTAGARPETVYVIGGTVSGVIQAGVTIANTTNVAVTLAPNESVQVTYSSVPFMNKVQH